MKIILHIYHHGTKIETKTIEVEQLYHQPPVMRLDLGITTLPHPRPPKP